MDFDFSKPYDTQDTIPEQFRPFFIQGEDKKFVLGPQFQGAAEIVTGLNRALKAERKSKPDLSGLSEFGTTTEEITTKIKSTLADLNAQLAAKANINPEKIKQEFAKQHGEEITKLTKRNEGLQSQLYQYLVDAEATAAIAAAKGVPNLLLPFVRSSIRVAEENGKFVVQVVDAAGDRQFNMAGAPMSVSELVQKMKNDPQYGRLFDSDTPSGGGMPPKPPGTPPVRQPVGEKSSIQKIQEGLRTIKKGT